MGRFVGGFVIVPGEVKPRQLKSENKAAMLRCSDLENGYAAAGTA